MEKKIWIPCGDFQLEAMHAQLEDGQGLAVVTHPHPLYGGNMDNPVVMTLVRAFQSSGYSTLRFNFRGAGRSGGIHDNGVGEVEDLKSVLQYMDSDNVFLAGYSFGSRVNALFMGMDGTEAVRDHIMVSPPVAFISFDGMAVPRRTGLVITGQGDDFAPPGLVEAQLADWGMMPRFEVIPQCDHFYSNGLDTLGEIVLSYLAR
ncbi:MAG: alpha/beta hydrolase [Desulfobacterales bacterium]|nr:alpha/beta hydrolase [Desulfobacterales bacterium]